jgi:hypothetical protein
VANIGKKSGKSASRGRIFSMPNKTTWIFGNADVSRAFPSFSVIEIIPVSATAKLAPVMPMSAAIYAWRSAFRAVMLSASGSVVTSAPSFC